jgi:putative ABC transport system permease protein
MRFSTIILRNLLRRRGRSALTVLGLAIGIAAVVALLGIAWGFERSFMAIYRTKGIDLVVVRAGVSDSQTSSLDASLADRIKKVEGVREVARSLLDAVSFEEANLVGVLVNGWEPGSLLFRGIRVLEGRSLAPPDKRKAMLGRVLAMNLNRKVGDAVDVSGETFQVVGIIESESWFENGALIIPLADLQWMMGRQGQVTAFMVAAEDGSDPRAIEALARRIERAVHGVAAIPARDFVQANVQIRLVQAMAWATSVIALILGSLGVLNTMVMAVFERTREIGVLRALGWRKRRILALILGESMALGLAGVVAGTALGYAGVRALSLSPTGRQFIAPDLPPAILGVGVALGMGLSLLGGLYPALRGAALDPTEALRHE